MRLMNDSGNQWMGFIPHDWQTIKGKYLFTIETGKLDANAEDSDGKYPFFTCSMYPKNINKYAFDCEALLVAGNGLVGFTQYYNGKFNAYQRTYVLNNFQNISPHFLKHYISLNLPPEAEYKSVGSVIQFIKYDDLANFLIPYPDIDTQIRIANFLNQKCSEIDSLYSDIQSQIDVLEEYKKSVIAEAVTKGLNPDVEMKDSGIEWIGMIPKKWVLSRLKYNLSEPMKYGASETGVDFSNDLPRYIRITDITSNGKLKEEGKVSLTFMQANNYLLTDGTVLFARSGATVGKTFLYTKEHGVSAFAGYLISGITDKSKMLPKWLWYYTLSNPYWEWANQIFTQATIQNIGADKYSNLPITIPDIDTQKEIIMYLDEKCSEIDAIISDKKAQLETLAEYKNSLIYEYVTGKKEVPENV